MINITDKETYEVLYTLDADTLAGSDLSNANLSDAHLSRANLIRTNLGGANLTGAILYRANLSHANLTGAVLYHSDLSDAIVHNVDIAGANLIGADLTCTILSRSSLSNSDLTGANLSGANMRDVNLSGANLTKTNMVGVNMRDANLFGANLFGSDMSGANLSHVVMGNTNIINCPTLHKAKGLSLVAHQDASNLDARTLRACANHLPDVFLRGVGYNREEIENIRAMYAGGGIKYYSCFIAYRRADYSFAKYLHDQLEAAGVTCWLDEQDMQGGKYERPQIQAAIKAHDKLLLICSEEMVVRPRVVEEVIAALQAEREGSGRKLFPVRLDDYICSKDVLAVADAKLHKGEWSEDWIRAVQAYHIPDFEHWKDHDRFQEQFQRLLRDLKAQPDA